MAAAIKNGNTQIVVCDAMQVYRKLDIGTAKPTLEDQSKVVHHCVDLVDSRAKYTVSDYQTAARTAVAQIQASGNRPLVVAGTGLYLTALIDDLQFPGNWPSIRQDLEAEPNVDLLYKKLIALDPVSASRIERTNRRRIERALEVCIGSGKPFSETGPGTGAYPDNGIKQIGLLWKREMLAERVAKRVHAMMAAGFLAEVRELRSSSALSQTSRQALGYKELIDHLDGNCSLDAAVEAIITHTRQFAVRQERWFRRDPRIVWVNIESDPASEIASLLDDALG